MVLQENVPPYSFTCSLICSSKEQMKLNINRGYFTITVISLLPLHPVYHTGPLNKGVGFLFALQF